MSSSFVIRATLIIHLILVLGLVASSHDGGRWAHGVVLQKRSLFKQGHHLFNNVPKAVAKIVFNSFHETDLQKYVTAEKDRNNHLLLTSNTNNANMGAQFQQTIENYKRLVTAGNEYDRNKLAVHLKKQVPDKNSIQWGKCNLQLRELTYNSVDEAVEQGRIFNNLDDIYLKHLFEKIKYQADYIKNNNVCVDEEAVEEFKNQLNQLNNKKEKDELQNLMNIAEQKNEIELDNLPYQIIGLVKEVNNSVKKL